MTNKRDNLATKNVKNASEHKSDKKIKNDDKATKDITILEESFNLVKDLKKQIEKIHKSKEELKNDVKNLEQKIANKENKESQNHLTKNNSDNNILLSLKEEITKDFEPILNKFNLKSTKDNIIAEIHKILEFEFQKIRSEFDSKSSKNKKEFTQKLSDLEAKVLQSISKNKNISEKLRKEPQKITLDINTQIEEKIQELVKRASQNYLSLIDATNIDIDDIKTEITKQKKQEKNLLKKIDDIIKFVRQNDQSAEVDLTSMLSKIKMLEEDNKSIKSLLERYENDLYKKSEDEKNQIVKQSQGAIIQIEQKIALIQSDKEAQENFICNKINEIIDFVSEVEKKIKTIEKKDLSVIEKKALGILNEKIYNFEERIKDFLTATKKELNKDAQELFNDKKEIIQLFNSFKAEFEKFKNDKEIISKSLKEEFQSELERLNEFAKSTNLSAQKSFSDVSLEVKNLEQKFTEKNEEYINNLKKSLNKEVISLIENSKQSLKEDKNNIINEFELYRKSLLTKIDNEHQSLSSKFDLKILELNESIRETNTEAKKLYKLFKTEKEAQKKFLVDKHNLIIDDIKNMQKELQVKNLSDISILSQNQNTTFQKELQTKMSELQNMFNSQIKKLEIDFITSKSQIEDIEKCSITQIEEKIKIIGEGKVYIEKFVEETKEKLAKQLLSNNEYLTKINLENKEQRRDIAENIEIKFNTIKDKYDSEFNSNMLEFNTQLKQKEQEFIEKLKIIEEDKKEMLKELDSFRTDIGLLTKTYVTKLDDELERLKSEESRLEHDKQAYNDYINQITSYKKAELEDCAQNTQIQLKELITQEKNIFEQNENSFRELFNEKITNLNDITIKKLDNLKKSFVDRNLKYVTEEINKELEIFKLYEEELKSKEEEINLKLDLVNNSQKDFFTQMNAHQQNLTEKITKELNLKEIEINQKLEFVEKTHNEFLEDVEIQKEEIAIKVEERITNFEKHFNKRFLDYDTSFSAFKGVVVEEVESLIKEVNDIVNSRIEKIDTLTTTLSETYKKVQESLAHNVKNITKSRVQEFDQVIAKLNFTNNEMKKSFDNLNNLKESIEKEIRDIRDEVSDNRVKIELFNEVSTHSMNDHVQYMAEYERQLVGLIRSLKNQGISNDRIKTALRTKGHPQFYISMVLKDFDKIYN